MKIVKVCPGLKFNEEDCSSEDILIQPLKQNHYNLPSSETKDMW
jgi:hypothetical protein